jgi:diguanylate cyclase (GGDEF)-like protein
MWKDTKLENSRGNILVVDDDLINLKILSRLLGKDGYQVVAVETGREALIAAQNSSPDLILLDIRMEDMDGYAVCRQLRDNPATSDIPVIFISALDQAIDKVKAFDSGGRDYMQKPFHADEVMARVEVHLALRTAEKALQEKNAQLEKEIQARKVIEDKLRYLAITDPLTQVFNRRHFFETTIIELERTYRYDKVLSVIICDIDYFKGVNDRYGHIAGDQVLCEVVKRFQGNLRSSDVLARYGGEEFVILLPETNTQRARLLGERLRAVTENAPIVTDSASINITISVGVVGLEASKNEQMITIDQLLDRADKALYHSKENGRNRVSVWNPV